MISIIIPCHPSNNTFSWIRTSYSSITVPTVPHHGPSVEAYQKWQLRLERQPVLFLGRELNQLMYERGVNWART